MGVTTVCNPGPEQDLGLKVVAEARRWIGTAYRHQASTMGSGTDCLGLIRGVWRSVIGAEPVKLPPYSMDWCEASGDEALMCAADIHLIKKPDLSLSVGDVILFRIRQSSIAKHLGIVSAIGEAPRFIHAYSGLGVVENHLSAPWAKRIAAVYCFPEESR
jgi:NlpC/P60 family putative phage cell wall peptidase